MFWGSVVESGKALKSTAIFEAMEFPALHISQAVLEDGTGNVKVQVKMNKKDTPIIIAVLNKQHPVQPINTYFNMTQTFSIQVVSETAQKVHLSGHFEAEGQEAEDQMMYGDEDDMEESEEEDESEEGAKGKNSPIKAAHMEVAVAKLVENLQKAQVNKE